METFQLLKLKHVVGNQVDAQAAVPRVYAPPFKARPTTNRWHVTAPTLKGKKKSYVQTGKKGGAYATRRVPIVSFLKMSADQISQLKDMAKREVLRHRNAPKKRTKRLSTKAKGVLYKISSSKSIISSCGDFHAREMPNASSPLSIIQCFAVIVLSIMQKSHVLSVPSQSSLIPAVPKKYKIFNDSFSVLDMSMPSQGYSVLRSHGTSSPSHIDSGVWRMSPRVNRRAQAHPTLSDIIKFVSRIYVVGKMEKDVLIPALAYVEKFCIDGYKSGFMLKPQNWRTVVFTMLILSCKMWDDLSITNMDMTNLWKGITLERINQLERHGLEILKYSLNISPGTYSAYYFKMRELHCGSTLLELCDPNPYLYPLLRAKDEENQSTVGKLRPSSAPNQKKERVAKEDTKKATNNDGGKQTILPQQSRYKVLSVGQPKLNMTTVRRES